MNGNFDTFLQPPEIAEAMAAMNSPSTQEAADKLRLRGFELYNSTEFRRVFNQPHVKLALAEMAALSELPMNPAVMLLVMATCSISMAALED